MLHPAKAGDAPAIEAFLVRHAETSMFLRGNLARHGLFDEVSEHATRYWLAKEGGEITAVFGMSNAGNVFTQAPEAPDALWRAFADAIAGRNLAGIIGEPAQVARAEGAETAILFASGPAACRAYEAIGFERIGGYTLALLSAPVTIGGAP